VSDLLYDALIEDALVEEDHRVAGDECDQNAVENTHARV